jgi:DNA-binding IclR family transcriptional regulator
MENINEKYFAFKRIILYTIRMSDTLTPAKSGTKPVGAAKLTIEILRCLAKQRGAIGVTPLANKLDRYPGTVYAVLKTLQAEGVVEFNPSTKTYRLCLGGILEISALKREQDLPRKIEFEMNETSDQFGTCIYLSQKVRPNAMIIIACAAPDQPLGLYAKIGHRFPVLMGAVGRLLTGLSGTDDAHLKDAYEKYRWNRHQPSFDDWSKQVCQDIAAGYAYEEDSVPEGLATIAVPIIDGANPIKFAINVIGPRGDFAGERLPQLVTAAKHLAERAKAPR